MRVLEVRQKDQRKTNAMTDFFQTKAIISLNWEKNPLLQTTVLDDSVETNSGSKSKHEWLLKPPVFLYFNEPQWVGIPLLLPSPPLGLGLEEAADPNIKKFHLSNRSSQTNPNGSLPSAPGP